jgi:hypothetical protein
MSHELISSEQSSETLSTTRVPRPPRTRRDPELDSERFLRYLLAIVISVAALLSTVAIASVFLI